MEFDTLSNKKKKIVSVIVTSILLSKSRDVKSIYRYVDFINGYRTHKETLSKYLPLAFSIVDANSILVDGKATDNIATIKQTSIVEEQTQQVVKEVQQEDVSGVPTIALQEEDIQEDEPKVVDAPVVQKRERPKVKEEPKREETFWHEDKPFGNRIWHNIAEFKNYLIKEKKYREDEHTYFLELNENILELNMRNNIVFDKENSEFKKQLAKAGVMEGRYGANCIYNGEDDSRYLNTFSKNYHDFIESEKYKREGKLEIIKEYKKGEATRDYLDMFIDEIKDGINNSDIKLSEDDIENQIDESLGNWARDIKDVRTRTDDFEFIKETYVSAFYENENYYMPYSEWFRNDFPKSADENVYDYFTEDEIGDYGKIKKYFLRVPFRKLHEFTKNGIEDDVIRFYVDKVLKRNYNNDDEYKQAVERVERLFSDAVDSTLNIRVDCYKNKIAIGDLMYKQDSWIFEYNKGVLESKKEIIREGFKSNYQIILD